MITSGCVQPGRHLTAASTAIASAAVPELTNRVAYLGSQGNRLFLCSDAKGMGLPTGLSLLIIDFA